jgi:hypothetical protein
MLEYPGKFDEEELFFFRKGVARFSLVKSTFSKAENFT